MNCDAGVIWFCSGCEKINAVPLLTIYKGNLLCSDCFAKVILGEAN